MTFWSCRKHLDKEGRENFEIYVTNWETNNYITNIARYFKGNQKMKFGELKKYKMTNIFLQKSCTK